MAGVFHISEADAACDFSALMDRVRASDLVVVGCEDGTEALIRARSSDKPRTIAEALKMLKLNGATSPARGINPEFASDMEAVKAIYNAPWTTRSGNSGRHQRADRCGKKGAQRWTDAG